MHTLSLLIIDAALTLTACSNSASTQPTSIGSSATLTVNSQQLYKAFAAIPSAQAGAIFHSLQGMSVNDYYAYKAKITTSGSMLIDGKQVLVNVDTAAHKALVANIAASYPTIGKYWASLGVTSANISEASFAKGMQQITGGGASLGLYDETLGAFCNPDTSASAKASAEGLAKHFYGASADLSADALNAELTNIVSAANRARNGGNGHLAEAGGKPAQDYIEYASQVGENPDLDALTAINVGSPGHFSQTVDSEGTDALNNCVSVPYVASSGRG